MCIVKSLQIVGKKEGRSATASANYLYVDKDEEILDHEFQLQLNGRILEEIRLDGALLNEHDYTIEGETLSDVGAKNSSDTNKNESHLSPP